MYIFEMHSVVESMVLIFIKYIGLFVFNFCIPVLDVTVNMESNVSRQGYWHLVLIICKPIPHKS